VKKKLSQRWSRKAPTVNESVKALGIKVLQFAYTKLGKASMQLAQVVGTWLASAGVLTEDNKQTVIGALAVLLGAVLDWGTRNISDRFIRNAQKTKGLTVDGYAGPKTRANHALST